MLAPLRLLQSRLRLLKAYPLVYRKVQLVLDQFQQYARNCSIAMNTCIVSDCSLTWLNSAALRASEKCYQRFKGLCARRILMFSAHRLHASHMLCYLDTCCSTSSSSKLLL